MNTPQNDMPFRITFSIECYDHVQDDDPAEVWFSTDSLSGALTEAAILLEKGSTITKGNKVTTLTYAKIEIRTYETDKKVAVLYR